MPLNSAGLLVILEEGGRLPLRVRLTMALRDAVRTGQASPGSTLPSSRVLARDIGISRGVVLEAYAQLTAEGYLLSRPGAGTTVAATQPHARPVAAAAAPQHEPAGVLDLRPGTPDLSSFPRRMWLGAVRDTLNALPASALGYGEPWGARALRVQLADYLARVRGAMAEPDSVVVVTGTTQGISLIAQLLVRRGQRAVAVEDPSNALQRRLLRDLGLEVVDVPVDDSGLRVDALAATGVRAVLCTPAHQYPTGVILSAERRTQLMRWAQDVDGLVIEDDYDAEFRYGRAAVGCLQGLDDRHVALLGSVSKSLAPALRLGWVLAPPGLLDDLRRAKSHADFGSNGLDQHVLAELMATGAYDRNLRLLRRRYGERREHLVGALAARAPSWRPIGAAGGLHLVVRLPPGLSEQGVVVAGAAAGVLVVGLAGMTGAHPQGPSLALAYARATPDMLDEAVHRLVLAADGLGARPTDGAESLTEG
ncbi:MAG: PLP-dependent aminotransferase family protein [Actinomycetota bacterium]|nr:PLP-dependent aminotransferase family protein [Actinomycetota bacterium]